MIGARGASGGMRSALDGNEGTARVGRLLMANGRDGLPDGRGVVIYDPVHHRSGPSVVIGVRLFDSFSLLCTRDNQPINQSIDRVVKKHGRVGLCFSLLS